MNMRDRVAKLEYVMPRKGNECLDAHLKCAVGLILSSLDMFERLDIGARLLAGIQTEADGALIAELNSLIDPALLSGGIDAALILQTEASF